MDGIGQFYYSLDGVTFIPIGDKYMLTWGSYRGDRIGIFTFNNAAEEGYIDIDWFHYDFVGDGPAR